MQLYYHKTDGGAEYLCSSKVNVTKDMVREGVDPSTIVEGDMRNSKYIVRIDGDITKDAELSIRD